MDTDKIPQCKIPNVWFLAANLLGALTGNPASSAPRVFLLFVSWGRNPPLAISPPSHKNSIFQVIQATLFIHAYEREVSDSPDTSAGVYQLY